MKINVVDVDEIEAYINDLYDISNSICKEAKKILNNFKHEYYLDIEEYMPIEDSKYKPNMTIECFEFYKYLIDIYDKNIELSIRLLQYAIRDNQYRKTIK